MKYVIPAFITGLAIGVVLGGLVAYEDFVEFPAKECAKEHNVYECEIKFVPKEVAR